MYNFTDIVTVNTRRLKKYIKTMPLNRHADPKLVSMQANAISETYRGRFVVLEDSGNGNLVCIQHAPELIHVHQKIRNVPTSLVRRIRKANPEWANKLIVEGEQYASSS